WHVQEVIVQNFRAKPRIPMARQPEPSLEELRRTLAVARLVLGADMNVQAPPNLSPGTYPALIASGLNDWGGVSPLTIDYIHPEAPRPLSPRPRRRRPRPGAVSGNAWPSTPSTFIVRASSPNPCATGS